MKQGQLFVVSGPSGTGKGAICSALCADGRAMLSVSMTTRTRREGEVDGVSYHFASRMRFEELLKKDGFFEYAEVYDAYYGTPKAPVLSALACGRDAILEIEMQGAAQVKACMPEAVLVFILPPSLEELRRRIEGRGTETPERINYRLSRARDEIALLVGYDYCVVNDKLEDAIQDVRTILSAVHLTKARTAGEPFSEEEAVILRRAETLRLGASAQQIIERYTS